MAENTGNTEWKITPSGEKQLTVVLPDDASISEGIAEIEPETLLRALAQWVEDKKKASKVGGIGGVGVPPIGGPFDPTAFICGIKTG